jgi:hypothetical protein
MALAAKDLSPLLAGQTDHLADRVALDADLGADALGDEELIDGATSSGPWFVPPQKSLAPEDAQREGGASGPA